MLQVVRWHVYHGPNPHAGYPCCLVSLGGVDELENTVATAACTRLHQQWPDLFCHEPASTFSTLEIVGATLASGILGVLNEVRGCVEGSGYRLDDTDERGMKLDLWSGFHHAELTGSAMQLVVNMFAAACTPDGLQTDSANNKLEALWVSCRAHHPDYQATILIGGARGRNIPVLPFINGSKFWQYGWGINARVFAESLSNRDGFLSGMITHNKYETKLALQAIGMPVPHSRLVNKEDELNAAVSKVGWPCVTKPIKGGGGRGVTAGLSNYEELLKGFNHAREFFRGPVLVEEFVPGEDHRLMVTGGKFIASIKRIPASVMGNGADTIGTLVKMQNLHRSINMPRSRYLRPIKIDTAVEQHLERQGLTLDSVIPEGKRLYLRSNSNLSTGGHCEDFTDQTHPELKRMCEQIALTLGIENLGLDYLTTDISASPNELKGAFVEANTTPGIDATIAAGWPPEKIADLILGNDCARIPVELDIVGESEIDPFFSVLASESLNAGHALVCRNKARVAEVPLSVQDDMPWESVRQVLRNQTVVHLRIVCAANDIMTHGLPVDWLETIRCRSSELARPWDDVLTRHSRTLRYE